MGITFYVVRVVARVSGTPIVTGHMTSILHCDRFSVRYVTVQHLEFIHTFRMCELVYIFV